MRCPANETVESILLNLEIDIDSVKNFQRDIGKQILNHFYVRIPFLLVFGGITADLDTC